jgi:hypothetical protein
VRHRPAPPPRRPAPPTQPPPAHVMVKHLMNEQARYYQLRFASNALASDAEILERQFLELTDTHEALLCAHEQLQADHTQLRDAYGNLCLAHSDARCELETIARAHDEEGALLTEDEGLDLQGEEGFGTDEGALGNKVAESDSRTAPRTTRTRPRARRPTPRLGLRLRTSRGRRPRARVALCRRRVPAMGATGCPSPIACARLPPSAGWCASGRALCSRWVPSVTGRVRMTRGCAPHCLRFVTYLERTRGPATEEAP